MRIETIRKMKSVNHGLHMVRQLVIISTLVITTASGSYAQHPVDVERKAASGDYMGALVSFDKLPKRTLTGNARLAAARSAWALSLPTRALEEYDRALQTPGLSIEDKARAHFSKGVVFYREGNFPLAMLEVDKSFEILTEKSALRANVLALAGQCLMATNALPQAEAKFTQALTEADPEFHPEIAAMLGEVQYELGKYEEARISLEVIPLRHPRATQAIKLLAHISIGLKNIPSAAFWLNKGRELYPQDFLDSWVDYVLIRGAIEQDNSAQVVKVRTAAEQRYAPSDPWLVVTQAAAEEYEWNRRRRR